MKEYKIVTSKSVEELSRLVNGLIKSGWEPIGSHQVATIHAQNRFAGTQHRDTIFRIEYSQTLIKEN